MAKKKKKNSNYSSAVTLGGGIILGIMAAPHAKKLIEQAKPLIDDLLDGFSKKAGEAVEKGSDIIAEAKEKMKE